MTYTTQRQVRAAFWEAHPSFTRKAGKGQNDYKCTVRSAFVEFVDALQRNGDIGAGLADRVTL